MSKGFNPGQPRDDHGRWTTIGSVAKAAKSSINGMSASSMSALQKLQAAAIMFGKGSKQYKTALDKHLKGK